MDRNGASAEPLRVAFVGQSVYFRQCGLEHHAAGIEPTFVDFRAGAAPGPLLARLRSQDPDAVVVFRPEIVPPGLFESLRATTIGYLTEPLPRDESSRHADLHHRLGFLKQVDPGNFDRIVSFDPLIAETAASVLPVWRSLPLPVADSLYMDVRPRSRPVRLLFLGRSTAHRERLLAPIKVSHPLVHIGHGAFGEELKRLLENADVQLNLHNHEYPSFENRVSIALAAGHLVISEPLSPTHGLAPGVDYLEATTPKAFSAFVEDLERDADAYVDIQHAGRQQAERFRASGQYPQLIRDALADVAERGTPRKIRADGSNVDTP